MPQNLVDTPPDWQDVIVVPAPGEPAAVANDPGKPHSLFHALAALAKRTRWLRGALEAQLNHHHDDRYSLLGHNHDDRYAPLNHHHDDRYYTKAEIDARRGVWAATISGERGGGAQVSIQVTAPASGPYLIEGSMVWGSGGQVYWGREIWIDGVRVYFEERYINGNPVGGSWVDPIIYDLTAGTHSVVYNVIPRIVSGVVATVTGMIRITRL